jgi:hypothetical protein
MSKTSYGKHGGADRNEHDIYAYSKMNKFYECGICDHYHPIDWDGDCRDDDNRFSIGDLDEKFGSGWEEVDMPV